jgi:DNA repair photolyase
MSRRAFFSGNRDCKLGCRYCFAKFDNYVSETPHTPYSSSIPDDVGILYPSCNGDFFSDSIVRDALKQTVYETDKRILVSISIKSRLALGQAQELAEMNAKLARDRRGLVKCSVSITTKNHLEEYEPRAARYGQRLDSLELLAEAGVPRSVNLKPVLPFIGVEEYQAIVDDCAVYSDVFLLGGLYLDGSSAFGRKIAKDFPLLIGKRQVEWLPGRPVWQYCADEKQIASVRGHIRSKGKKACDSDIDVVQYLFSAMSLQHAA